jgi:PAS domain S-box-containing protein
VFESRAIGMSVFDARTGETLLANDRLLEMTGATRAAFEEGRWDWRKATPPEHLPLEVRAIEEALARGWWDPYEKEYLRPDGSRLPVRLSSAPLPGEPGRVVVLVQDISEQREAEHRRDLLAREVDHRAKNTLAVVQAALRLTPKDDAASYAREVEGRVAALARAHGLLADGLWKGATLRTLVEGELATFLPDGAGVTAPRVEASGPELLLAPAATQALAMALHELATNATKYGALGTSGGRVGIRWSADCAAGVLRVVWEERGGPPVLGSPSRRGFGSRVVEAVLGGQLGGRVERRWEAEGLVCQIELPLDRVSAREPASGGAPGPAP